jgi:hypothetical protein
MDAVDQTGKIPLTETGQRLQGRGIRLLQLISIGDENTVALRKAIPASIALRRRQVEIGIQDRTQTLECLITGRLPVNCKEM